MNATTLAEELIRGSKPWPRRVTLTRWNHDHGGMEYAITGGVGGRCLEYEYQKALAIYREQVRLTIIYEMARALIGNTNGDMT